MRSKKMISIMKIMIIALLTITIIGILINTIKMEGTRRLNIYKVANNVYNSNIENIKEENNETQLTSTQGTQELKSEIVYNGENVVSRSIVDRQNEIMQDEELYINLNQNDEQDYQELVQYIKLEDVKISFDMDVSKTTGLSKEDFVSLVQKMKYDTTGILERNAGWIWECCQKYSVNEIFVLGICGIESNWCAASQHQNTHNYSSLMSGGKLISYGSDEAGFEAMIKLLGQKYLTPGASLYSGKTITNVGKRYCNATTWPKKVYKCMQLVFE